MTATITISTDFGLTDGYVAAMKGTILTINPAVQIVDITNRISPQNIKEAAFILSTVYRYFPAGTIHIVFVDPGVGTRRKAIVIRTPIADFVAPDNGVLSYVLRDLSHNTNRVIPETLEAVTITNTKYWRNPVSHTFHGRDIFAPVAAHLSLGLPLTEFGQPITSINTFPIPEPRKSPDGSLSGEIIHIDSFGNMITDIAEQDLPGGTLIFEIIGKTIHGLSHTYGEGKELLAIIGSSGYLEIALNEGNASVFLQAQIGTGIKVQVTSSNE